MIKYRIEWVLPTGGASVGEAVYDTREDAERMASLWNRRGAGEYHVVAFEDAVLAEPAADAGGGADG